MNEANIAEITKRNILSNAGFRCEVCGITLGYEKDIETPHFYFLLPPLQGGNRKETNVTVLCLKDGERLNELDKEYLQEKVLYREVAEPDT
jgi:hypothetical protein